MDRDRLIVRLDGHTVDAVLARPGSRAEPVAATEVTPDDWGNVGSNFARALQTIDPGSVETALVVGSTQVVHRHLRLPPTSDRELDGLLSFEIERHTPFRPDEVYLAYSRQPSSEGDAIGVTVSVAPKRVLDPLIASLGEIGYAPSRLVLGDAEDRALSVPLAGSRATRRGVRFSLAILALFAVAAVTSPLVRLEVTARDAARTARAEAMSQANTLGGMEADAAAARFLLTQRSTHPSPVAMLDELARVLPDGSWLTFVSQAGREVTLEGETLSSADLVPRLEASPWFVEVTFDAPVTRQTGGDGERFAFSVKIEDNAR